MKFSLSAVAWITFFVLGAWPQFALAQADSAQNTGSETAPGAGRAAASDLKSADPAKDDILNLDIDQLGKVDVVVPSFDTHVTSVNRQESTIGKSPAAIYVITNDMIRRSGVTSVPEALRMAPGVDVARIDSNKWAISIRGFNSQYGTKLLVLVDGRSVYTPFNNGVYWETQDLVLQDIDRIEVIRGPGSTVWGNNAVNGVINIITTRAGTTKGAMIATGGGSTDKTINAFRYDGDLGQNTHFRLYAKQEERGPGFSPAGSHDDWRMHRLGFRIDWEADPQRIDTVTLQGSYYGGLTGETNITSSAVPPFARTYVTDNNLSGGFASAVWNHKIDDDASTALQAYWDRTHRNSIDFDMLIDIFDINFQHNFKAWDVHRMTWGVENRLTTDDVPTNNRFGGGVNPESLTFDQPSAYFQDQMPLFREDVTLTLGTRIFVNNFTGFEYQPGAKALWAIDTRRAVWGGVSRAVRTPSRFEENAFVKLPVGNPLPLLMLRGSTSLQAEDLMAYELGYRQQVTEQFSWDAAAFYNVYDNLIAPNPNGLASFFPLTLNAPFANSQSARTYGVELSTQWQIQDNWRLRAWYSFLQMQVQGPGADQTAGLSPMNQAWLMSSWDLPYKCEFDLIPRYVDNLPAQKVNSYTSLDARLGWRPSPTWDFSIVGQNLLQSHHLEFAQFGPPIALNRGVFAQAVWRH